MLELVKIVEKDINSLVSSCLMSIFSTNVGHQEKEARAGVYETLCPQHMLVGLKKI